ncbi:tetratricopeptide repeat protein [Haliangium sp.]|uniref:tetratricopeptide repeat protein n=1 Tax=Haliangium sp. TaxID=2663208 RepID=UPI003D0C6A69
MVFLASLGIFAAALGAAGGLGCGATAGARGNEQSRTHLDLAKDFLSKGQSEAAAREARKALALAEGDPEVHYVLGLIELVNGHAAYRMSAIDDCLTGIDAEVQIGEEREHLEAAEGHLRRACELDPEFGEAWANRGIAATRLGRHATAVEYFEHALEHPARLQSVAFVRVSLGWVHFLRDDMVAATRDLLQATRLQPTMCLASYRLGRVYFARKEWEKALRKFQEVADQPQCPIQDAHLYLMKTYVELGSSEELADIARSCVSMAPRSCIASQCTELAGGLDPDSLMDASQPGTTEDVDQVP